MSQQALTGSGSHEVRAEPEQAWSKLLDPETLRALIPGTESVVCTGGRYEAWLSYGVGRVRSRYRAELQVSDPDPPHSLALLGKSKGGLGWGRATAFVTLEATSAGHTTIHWKYEGVIGGPVSLLGGLMLRAAARGFVGRFFAALAHHCDARLAERQ